jgi:hypothetical protein
MPRIATSLAALLLLAATPALAQPAALNGTLEAVEPGAITLRDEAGAAQRLALAPGLLVLRNAPATLADIRPTDYIASAAMRGTDGRLHSVELRIFPEALRGAGEGQRPMSQPGQTMTNATVAGTALANGSNTLNVTFPGGSSELVVDPGVPVTRIEPADRTTLVQGAKVRVQRGADGAAARITLLQ